MTRHEKGMDRTMKTVLAIAVVSMMALAAQAEITTTAGCNRWPEPEEPTGPMLRGCDCRLCLSDPGYSGPNELCVRLRFSIYSRTPRTDTDWTGAWLDIDFSKASAGDLAFRNFSFGPNLQPSPTTVAFFPEMTYKIHMGRPGG